MAACAALREQPETKSPLCRLTVKEVAAEVPQYIFGSEVALEGATMRAATYDFGDGERERVTEESFSSKPHSYVTETGNYVVSSEVEIQEAGSSDVTTVDCEPQVIAIIPSGPPQTP